MLTIQDYDLNAIKSSVLDGNVKKGMIKFHPTDKKIAVRTGSGLHLYTIDSKTVITFKTDPQGEFDFNEDGTQICTVNKDNCLTICDLDKNTCFHLNIKTAPSSVMRNINTDFFVLQHEDRPQQISIASSRNLTTLEKTMTVITPPIDFFNSTVLPNTINGQLLLYEIKDYNTASIHCFTFPKMLGIKIKNMTYHNLACIYAMARASDAQAMSLLKSPKYHTIIEDTATKDSCFQAALNNMVNS